MYPVAVGKKYLFYLCIYILIYVLILSNFIAPIFTTIIFHVMYLMGLK